MTLLRRLLPPLALASGYLLCWLFWGAPLWAMLLLLFGGAALWTLVPRRGPELSSGQGGWTFSRSLLTVLLLSLSLWVIGAGVVGVSMVASPDNPLPLGWPQLLPLLLAGGGVVAASLAGVTRLAGRAGRERGRPVILPWLWLAGVLGFALFPAVTVDCRNIDADPYRSHRSGFLGASRDQFYWARKPHLIPGRAELGADLQIESIFSAVTHCSRDARGRPRLFSWRASAPLLVLYLEQGQGARRRYDAAVFTPGEHRKLTRWTPVPSPFPVAKDEMPYLVPFWAVGRVLPELPAELRSAVGNRSTAGR